MPAGGSLDLLLLGIALALITAGGTFVAYSRRRR
jgi:hypothetical protein